LDDVVVRHEQAQTYVIHQEVADADAATFDTQTPAFLRSFVSSQSVVLVTNECMVMVTYLISGIVVSL